MPSTLLNFKQPITGLGRLKGMKKKMYCYCNKHVFSRINCCFLEMQQVCFLWPGPHAVEDYTSYFNERQKWTQSCTSQRNVLSQNIPGDVKAAGRAIRLVSDAATYFFEWERSECWNHGHSNTILRPHSSGSRLFPQLPTKNVRW